VGICIKQDNWEKSLSVLTKEFSSNQSNLSSSEISLNDYATQIVQLKQYHAISQQQTKEWKFYTDNFSASVICVPEYHKQITVKELEVGQQVYVNNKWR
jgi:hypothetical protein